MVIVLEDAKDKGNMSNNNMDEGLVSVSNLSTKSSQGRKLRQVLQKKQLDVLLQTYSSFIDETEEKPIQQAATHDFSLIARKSSIEGNPGAVNVAAEMELLRKCRSEASMGEDRAPTNDWHSGVNMSRSMMDEKEEDDDDDESCYLVEEQRQQHDSVNNNSDEAVVVSKWMKAQNNHKEAAVRRSKKRNSSNKRKSKKVDFSTRMHKAGETLKSFSERAFEKQLEVATDFQKASKEIGYQLKSGANIALEELADQFDGMVEKVFASEISETRDENGEGARINMSRLSMLASQKLARIMETHCSGDEERDSDFQPRSHDETLEAMNHQVQDMFEPVAVLAARAEDGIAEVAHDLSAKAQLHCAGRVEDVSLPSIEAAGTEKDPLIE